MSKPRTYQTEAIVIKKTKLGEADRILTLFTPDMGKVQAVAKGVRRPRSKLAGHLELLTHSTVMFARGRNLDTITASQTINGFLPLKSDLDLTACALYAAELVNQFTPDHQENRLVFDLLLSAMRELCVTANRELLLRHFELHLLHEAGYRPQLQHCVACRQPLQPAANYFSVDAGGVLCPDCRGTRNAVYPISVDALKVLRFLQDKDFDVAGRLKVGQDLARELERLMRNYIRYLLEREIKSAAWLDSLRAGAEAA